MLRFRTLASGSTGNASLLSSGSTHLLIDAGLSARQLSERMALCGVEPGQLAGVIITHEHSDHAKGLANLCKNTGIPIYCNAHTRHALRRGSLETHPHWRIFQTGASFDIGCLSLQTFTIPHDAVDPIGLVVRHGTASAAVLTDLGYATRLILERTRAVQLLLIEANHDEKLLHEDTRRPWSVKQRILSRHGHLSNAASAQICAEVASGPLEHLLLGHLSRDCNRPDLALTAVKTALNGRSMIGLSCCGPDEPGPTVEI